MDKHPSPPDLLAAYVDDELGPAARSAIAAHLADCVTCREDVEGQRLVKRALAADVAVPADLAARVRARAYPPPARAVLRPMRPRPAMPRAWLLAPAFALLLLFAVLTLGALRIGPFAERSAAAAAAEMSVHDHESGALAASVTGALPQVCATLAITVGMPITAPKSLPSGYQFMGGHDLSLGTTEGAHLVWEGGSKMLSLYQAADPGGAPPNGWQEMDKAGVRYWTGPANADRAVFWRADHMIYLLIGNLPEADLLTVAASVGG
ncbi:MAG: anti-sigma factor family protein [Chloroflexia bacterium]